MCQRWASLRSPIRFLATAFGLLALLIFVCTPAPAQTTGPPAKRGAPGGDSPRSISIATAGTTSTWYALAAGIALVLRSKLQIDANIEVSGGALDNMRRLRSGAADLGFASSVVPYNAYHGQDGLEKMENIRLLFGYAPSVINVVTLKRLPVQSIADLRGKRVSLGAAGSSALIEARLILSLAGLDPRTDIRGQQLTHEEAPAALADGKIDALFVSLTPPAAALVNLATTHDVRFLPIHGELRNKLLQANPSFFAYQLAGGTYRGQEQPVETVASMSFLASRATLDTDYVYRILQALYADQGKLVAAHSSGRMVTHENALKSRPIPFHPGAERYFKDVGAWK